MKTILDYAVRYTRAPGETKDTAVPFIVERNQATDLETIVENCIDRGLIAGLKPTAAHGIAEGIAEQLAREFSLGRSIAFGQYFYGRPYLQGTVGADGRLTAANGITVRLAKGNDFKLNLDDFTLRFNDGGNTPKIEFAIDNVSGERGVLNAGVTGQIQGFMLYAAGDVNKVVFAGAAGTGTEVTAFTKQGAQLLEFTVPNLAAGTYSVKVQRIDENGIVRETAVKSVTVKAGATPVVPAPTITAAGTQGFEPGNIEAPGGVVEVSGSNLETATAIDLLVGEDGTPVEDMELWKTLDATYDVEGGTLVTDEELDESAPLNYGAVRVTTAGGSASYPVQYSAH